MTTAASQHGKDTWTTTAGHVLTWTWHHLIVAAAGQFELTVRDILAHQTPPPGATAVFAAVLALALYLGWKLLGRQRRRQAA